MLAADPDIMLLDEPTNHLDLIAIEWLEKTLAELRAAFAVVSHDRRLLADLTRSTVWLDRGRTRRLDQGFAAFEAWRDALLEEEELARHKLDRRIVEEEHWMRYGVTARRKRNMRRVGELATMRRERREARRVEGVATMAAQDAKSSGALVIEAEKIGKSYGGRPVVKDFSTRVMRGDRVGVVGANGAGKTTLIKLLSGALAPDFGAVRLGTNVAMAKLDQRRASLKPTTTLSDALTGGGSRLRAGQRRAQARRRLHEGLPVLAGAGAHADRQAVGRRARPADAGARVGAAVEPDGARRADQRPRSRNARPAAGAARRLFRHDPDRQPRPRLPRPRSRPRWSSAEGDGRWREYAGGYSDIVAQRGYGLSGAPVAEAPKTEKAPAREATDRPAAKRKLSFNQKRALELLPGRIASLRDEIAALEAKLADVDLHGRDPAGFERATRAYADKRAELERAEDEWLALEILREGAWKLRPLDRVRACANPPSRENAGGVAMPRRVKVLVGSKKGVFILESDERRRSWRISRTLLRNVADSSRRRRSARRRDLRRWRQRVVRSGGVEVD